MTKRPRLACGRDVQLEEGIPMRRLVSVLVNVALLLGLLPASPPPVEASHPTGTPRYVVTLSPATDTNTVGTEHCVTATVVDRHNPNNPAVRNTPVRFTVTGANPTTGTVTTNSRGDPVTFCYTGTRAGTDTITAYPDVDNDNVQDADEQPGTATKVWNPAVPNSVVLTPATDTNPTGQEHCVTAVATDAFGNVTPNVRVVFTVTGANPRPATVRTTNASGEATFCYTGTNVGVDTIRAFADRDNDGTLDVGEPIGMATKTYVAATPATVVVAPATDTNPAGQEHCVTATVRDASGNPISGVVVRFTVAGANSAGGTATTNAAGVASFCYTGTRIGTDTITATADGDRDGTPETGEPTGTATKIYAAAAPQTVVLSPATDENTVGQEHCVTATVTDAFGNVAADTRVRFTVTGANAASGTATTDEAGEAEFCYTGTASGLDTITAIADANRNGAYETSEPTGTATKTYHPGTPATVVLSPPADENVVGDRHCVQASVRDTFGNPVPNVAVVFEVEGANPTGPRTVRTDASGNAVFCYTGTASGADLISAYADTNGDGSRQTTEALATAAAKFYQAGTPATVAVTPPTDTNRAGEEHCVTATVEDAFGNPVEAGVLVRFTVEGANTAAGTDTTDANGQAEFCYTGERVGTDIITAIADGNDDGEAETGEPMGTATKLYGPADPAVLTLEPP
ncbi:MAG TPA: Ig-like domain-containing protein, partial [Candidatus Limnocylindria bacterium]|nr:Ig-like domain-containing protein [Candidatus Limnocylindria bacterium]